MIEEDKKPKTTLIRHQKNVSENSVEEVLEKKDVSNQRPVEKKKVVVVKKRVVVVRPQAVAQESVAPVVENPVPVVEKKQDSPSERVPVDKTEKIQKTGEVSSHSPKRSGDNRLPQQEEGLMNPLKELLILESLLLK